MNAANGLSEQPGHRQADHLRRLAAGCHPAGSCSSRPAGRSAPSRCRSMRRPREHPVHRARDDPRRAVGLQRLGRLRDRAGGVDDVVLRSRRSGPARRRSRASPRPTFVSALRRLSMIASSASNRFAYARARSAPPASGDTIVRFAVVLPREVVDDHRRREQVIHRNVEEPLDLRLVQIHRQHPVGRPPRSAGSPPASPRSARGACPCGPAARTRSTASPP